MTNEPTYLPAERHGFHAAFRDQDGGKRELSDAVYETTDEATEGAKKILQRKSDLEKAGNYYFAVIAPATLCFFVAMFAALSCAYGDYVLTSLLAIFFALLMFYAAYNKRELNKENGVPWWTK